MTVPCFIDHLPILLFFNSIVYIFIIAGLSVECDLFIKQENAMTKHAFQR